jgi:hypothetical protein
MLNPTPSERMIDAAGRPYFLWDCDMTLAEFRRRLASDKLDLLDNRQQTAR